MARGGDFLGDLARGGGIFGGDKLPVTPAKHVVSFDRKYPGQPKVI